MDLDERIKTRQTFACYHENARCVERKRADSSERNSSEGHHEVAHRSHPRRDGRFGRRRALVLDRPYGAGSHGGTTAGAVSVWDLCPERSEHADGPSGPRSPGACVGRHLGCQRTRQKRADTHARDCGALPRLTRRTKCRLPRRLRSDVDPTAQRSPSAPRSRPDGSARLVSGFDGNCGHSVPSISAGRRYDSECGQRTV
jgi:hypothetical protein